MNATMEFKCPKCQLLMRIPRPSGPARVTCPECQQTIQVKAPSSVADPSGTQPAPAKPRQVPSQKTPKPAVKRTQPAPAFKQAQPAPALRPATASRKSTSRFPLPLVLGGAALLGLVVVGGVVAAIVMSSSSRVANVKDALEEDVADTMAAELAQRQPNPAAAVPAMGLSSKPRGMPDHVWQRIQADQATSASQTPQNPTPSTPQRPKLEPDFDQLVTSNATAHEQLLDQSLGFADQMEQIYQSGEKQDTTAFRDALRSALSQQDAIQERLAMLPRLNKEGAEKLRASLGDGRAQSRYSRLDALREKMSTSKHMQDKSFRIAFFSVNAAGLLKGIADATKPLPQPIGIDQKADLLVIEVKRDLLQELLKVQSDDQYQALSSVYQRGAEKLDRIEQDWGFFLKSMELMNEKSPYRVVHASIQQAIDRQNKLLSQTHGEWDDDSQYQRYVNIAQQLLASKQEKKQQRKQEQKMAEAAERERQQSFVDEAHVKGIDQLSKGQLKSVELLRERHPEGSLIVIHHDSPVPLKKRGYFIKDLAEIGCSQVRFYDPLTVLIYSGPLEDIVAKIDWGDVTASDPQKETIDVKVR